MFYALEILAKKGPLASMWLAGVMPSKMKRKQVLSADITILVQSVLTPQVALSQRTSAVLLHGAARMWQMQARVLLHDCTHLSAMVLSRATDSLSIDLPEGRQELTHGQLSLNMEEVGRKCEVEYDMFMARFEDQSKLINQRIISEGQIIELQLEQEESFDFNELAAERFSSIGGGPDAELRFSSFSIAPNAYDADAAFDDAGNPGHEPGFEDHQDLYSGFGQDPEDGNAEPTDGNIYDEQRLGEQSPTSQLHGDHMQSTPVGTVLRSPNPFDDESSPEQSGYQVVSTNGHPDSLHTISPPKQRHAMSAQQRSRSHVIFDHTSELSRSQLKEKARRTHPQKRSHTSGDEDDEGSALQAVRKHARQEFDRRMRSKKAIEESWRLFGGLSAGLPLRMQQLVFSTALPRRLATGSKRKIFVPGGSIDSDSLSDVEVRRKKNRGTDSGEESDPSVKSKDSARSFADENSGGRRSTLRASLGALQFDSGSESDDRHFQFQDGNEGYNTNFIEDMPDYMLDGNSQAERPPKVMEAKARRLLHYATANIDAGESIEFSKIVKRRNTQKAVAAVAFYLLLKSATQGRITVKQNAAYHPIQFVKKSGTDGQAIPAF